MNFKDSKERLWEGLEGKKGRGNNVIIILKNKGNNINAHICK